MMKKIKQSLLAVGAVVLVAGCSSNFVNNNNQLAVEPDKVSLQLTSAVDRASAALQTLAAVEQKRTPGYSAASVPEAPIQLMRTVTFDWTGPIEPVVQKMASRSGYKFRVQGDEPAVPVSVNVTAVENPVIEVLRDIGLQAGRRATVMVDAESEVVEVSYAPNHSM